MHPTIKRLHLEREVAALKPEDREALHGFLKQCDDEDRKTAKRFGVVILICLMMIAVLSLAGCATTTSRGKSPSEVASDELSRTATQIFRRAVRNATSGIGR